MTAENAEVPALLPAGRSAPAAPAAAVPPRGRLFRKYVRFFVGMLAVALLVNGGLDFWFAYQESQEGLFRVQQEKAQAAAARIEEFADGIVHQVGWTTRPQWAAGPLDQRRYDYVGLLSQVPAISEISELDRDGKEELKVSRFALDVVNSGEDLSQTPAFIEAQTRRVWFSPVYFRAESEPYMTLAMPRTGRNAGVTVAEVNLKLIWDVVTSLKIGQGGYAYVVDRRGKLIAHPDISLVLRDTDFSLLPQVVAALKQPGAQAGAQPGAPSVAKPMVHVARNGSGRSVLSAYAPIAPLGWVVFVEVPLREAFAPLYGLALRSALLLGAGFVCAMLVALLLARRMTGPIRALQEGAARIGAGDLDRRLDIKTGDELEALATQFNRMAADLQTSYAELEGKVEERTAELQESRTLLADAIESMSDGFALWDRDDRLVLFNLRAQQILRSPRIFKVGVSFEELIRTLLARGYYGEAQGEADSWLPRRLAYHRDAPTVHEQVLTDGSWLRVGEHRTQDGGTVTTWTDITVLKQSEAEARANADRLQQELDAARELQLGMLPHEFPAWSPTQPVQVFATMEPAREVGGDLYDCFYTSGQVFCFLVGDVSGKGAPAAMFMARTQSLLRMAAEISGDIQADDASALRIVESVNRELCQNNAERMFVTLFFGVLNTRTGTLAYVNAGHPVPSLLRAAGEMERLDSPVDMPLGVRRNALYRTRSTVLRPGDAIVLFTDGVPEAMNTDEQFYSIERLDTDLRAASAGTPEDIVRTVKERVDAFTGDAAKADDVTLFALRWHVQAV